MAYHEARVVCSETGLEVAKVGSQDLDALTNDIQHYLHQYSQDGPHHIETRVKNKSWSKWRKSVWN
jgi:hypothetical protein